MRYILENEQLKIEVDSFGAELKSVKDKKTEHEYMWYADAKFWGRTSPVLFPFVGSLKDKKYIYEGKEYPMGQHGFARDYEHTFVEQTCDTLWFEFLSSEETLAKYPFDFKLQIGYKLNDRSVTICWRVENTGDKEMHFSIGAHPAFNCPIHGEESKEGYKLFFGGVDEIHHHGNDVPTGMALREDICMKLENHRVTITKDFFDRCTYMIEGNQTGEVGIEDRDGNRIVTLRFNTPLFAIWSPEGKNAPFVCIEPWFGRCDAVDFSGSLEDREYTNHLKVGEVFSTEYVMEF